MKLRAEEGQTIRRQRVYGASVAESTKQSEKRRGECDKKEVSERKKEERCCGSLVDYSLPSCLLRMVWCANEPLALIPGLPYPLVPCCIEHGDHAGVLMNKGIQVSSPTHPWE